MAACRRTWNCARSGDQSVAATVYGLLDRGVSIRPDVAAETLGTVRITFAEGYAPVLIRFGGDLIEVGDDAGARSTSRCRRRYPTSSSSSPRRWRAGSRSRPARLGRAALARIADGRVDFSGKLGLGRKLLQLMSVHPSSVRT